MDTAVGDNKLVGYASVTKTYYVPESQQKTIFVANLNTPQLPLVVKEKELVAAVDLTTHKSDSIDLVSGKGMTKKRETLIKHIATGSEGTVSRPQAALITLLLGQDNSTFSKHLEKKYSGSFSGDLITKESSNEYFIVNLTSSEIMDVGKTHNEKGLKRYYKQIYPEATEQDFQNYVKTLSQAQSGDMVDVLEAFFSKEVLLYGRYNRDGDLANIALAMTRLPLGFGFSKGVMKFAPKPEVPSSLKPQSAGNVTTLFRGERSSVSPDVAFNQGLTSKGSHNSLEQHVTSNTTAGNFISTTSDKGIAQQFAGKNGYVYEIQTSNYVDVNKTLGTKSPFPEQMEFSVPGGVSPSEIKGAWVMKNGVPTGEFIPNPGFTGGK